MMDERICFEAIDNPRLKQQACEFMEQMTELCPSDAIVRATFWRLNGEFGAYVHVLSETADMHAQDRAHSWHELLECIKSALLVQIGQWRRHRFVAC